MYIPFNTFFTVDILATTDNVDKAHNLESNFIKKHDITGHNVYNILFALHLELKNNIFGKEIIFFRSIFLKYIAFYTFNCSLSLPMRD